MIDFNQKINELLSATPHHANTSGTVLCKQINEQTLPLLEWLHYLRDSEATLPTKILLDGTQAAIIEVASCLSLGLVRPAIFSCRAQVDMLLSWLYFKDHIVEWEFVYKTGNGYMLKTEVIEYPITRNATNYSDKQGKEEKMILIDFSQLTFIVKVHTQYQRLVR